MALWGGWNTAIDSGEEEKRKEEREAEIFKQSEAQQEIDNLRRQGVNAIGVPVGPNQFRVQEVAVPKGGFAKSKIRQTPQSRMVRRQNFSRNINQSGQAVGRQVGQFAGAAISQRPDFSQEQIALKQMFGGGDKIWGLGPESGTAVTIHNDLNPSQRGDYGTARLFGF